jgi:hypothetical protein
MRVRVDDADIRIVTVSVVLALGVFINDVAFTIMQHEREDSRCRGFSCRVRVLGFQWSMKVRSIIVLKISPDD